MVINIPINKLQFFIESSQLTFTDGFRQRKGITPLHIDMGAQV
jgi:hypothetical protein